MPIPLLVLIVVAAAAALGSGTVALKWDNIVVALKGKKLAVLGARAVGKTHLLRFLTTGTLPSEYRQTVAPEKTAARNLKLSDLKLQIKKTLDVSGDKAAYGAWKSLHDESDIVLYLVRGDRLIAGDADTEQRVRSDLKHISGWLTSAKRRPVFAIVGTHCDLDPEFAQLTPARKGDYQDNFSKLAIVQELVARAGGSQQAKVILGSLKTPDQAELLVIELLRHISA